MHSIDDNAPSAATRIQAVRRGILSWYARHGRSLPWRKTKNPYPIWVSEIMLQQTQVDTVIPYYHRFLTSFPTIHSLAKASLDDVLKAWENLGYYARARHMHACAKEIANRFGGKFPRTQKELTQLPGIGDYTAGAILSIAFGLPCAAVDANIRRVVSRLFAVSTPAESAQTKKTIAALADRLVPENKPGDFNEGMMDLGAMICLPVQPKCRACPVRRTCRAFLQGLQETIPIRKKRKPIPHHHMTAGVIIDKKGRILIVQRANKGLLGGLWKLPGGKKQPAETLEACLKRAMREELGVEVQVKEGMAAIHHAYTHFRITLHAFLATREAGKPKPLACKAWQWASVAELADFAFSKADRKILEAISNIRPGKAGTHLGIANL